MWKKKKKKNLQMEFFWLYLGSTSYIPYVDVKGDKNGPKQCTWQAFLSCLLGY